MPNTNSRRQYVTTYQNLVKRAGSSSLPAIYDYIVNSDVKDATKLSYLNAVISLKKLDSSLVKGNMDEINALRDKLNLKLEKDRKENNLNENQANVMSKVNMDDLNKMVDNLEQTKDKSTKALEDYLLMKMMISYPLRNDLMEVVLTNNKTQLRQPGNYLFLPKSGDAKLLIKEHKTEKKGPLDIQISPEITKDIRALSRRDPNRGYLFVNANNEPITSSALTHKLNRITKKGVGVPLSSTLIRKIYLTDKYSDVMDEMKKDSKMMGHSQDMQQKVYIANTKVKKSK